MGAGRGPGAGERPGAGRGRPGPWGVPVPGRPPGRRAGRAAGCGAGGHQGGGAAGEPGPYGALGEDLAALQEGRGERFPAQGAQGRQIVGAGVVSGRQGVLEELQIAGDGAGKGGAVAGEVGEEERSQPARLPDRLVHGAREPQAVLDILVGQGHGVEGDGEGTSEHPQLVRAERHAAS
ncbi:hypothetical protein Smic_34050 [Streptomyces microflavus]|uniref:Uncharacterized protein n=1 Tax=Streptomyces microflavus TaxID=1919 RepID=A0A7J0CR19_STRMI|nr:hypothetical protein Smic_34050 [Streptomyces microflavus]